MFMIISKEASPFRREAVFQGTLTVNQKDQTDIFPDQELVFLKALHDNEVHYWAKIYIYLEKQEDRAEYKNDRFGYVDVGTVTIDAAYPTMVSIRFSDEYCMKNGLQTGSVMIISSKEASAEELWETGSF